MHKLQAFIEMAAGLAICIAIGGVINLIALGVDKLEGYYREIQMER